MILAQQNVLDTIYDLAAKNGVTVSAFLDTILTAYTPDKSKLPRNNDGEIMHEDGNIEIELDLPNNVIRSIHEQALVENVTANEIILRAVNERINVLKTENPDKFEDL